MANRLLRSRWLVLLLLSACATPTPDNNSLGPCLVGFEQVGSDWFINVERDPPAGFVAGDFGAEAHIFLSGERDHVTEVMPALVVIAHDVSHFQIPLTTGPLKGLAVASVSSSYCRALKPLSITKLHSDSTAR